MQERLNKSRIYSRRDLAVSKTESETPEYMKKQRFSDDEIAVLQEKLKQWKFDNSWKCTCGVINEQFNFNCKCGKRKPIFNKEG